MQVDTICAKYNKVVYVATLLRQEMADLLAAMVNENNPEYEIARDELSDAIEELTDVDERVGKSLHLALVANAHDQIVKV